MRNTKKPTKRTTSDGKEYENIVADIHRQFAGDAVVTQDEKIIGKSGRRRQIDVSLRTSVVGYSVLVVIECKDYKRRVGIARVDELIGKINDVGASKGVIISDSGFDDGAIARAKSDSRIQLASVVDSNNASLRSRLYVPVQVAFHDLAYPYDISVTWEEDAEKPVDEANHVGLLLNRYSLIASSFDQFGKRFITDFYEWCADNICNIDEGEHKFSAIINRSNAWKVTGVCTFKKSVRTFINENIYSQGVGIFDHVTGKVSQGEGLDRININESEVVKNWRQVPNDYSLENCVNFFLRTATYNFDGIDGVVKDFAKLIR